MGGRKRAWAAAVVGGALLAACTGAPKTPGEQAARTRHDHFETMGKAFKQLGDEAKKSAPDAALMTAKINATDDLAKDLPNWFPAGSGPQDGVKSDSLEAVWTRPAEFAAEAAKFQAKTADLRASTPGGVVAMQPLVGELGGACKSCHDDFRKQ